METVRASWEGAVECRAYVGDDGRDMVRVYLRPWHGAGTHRELYDGPDQRRKGSLKPMTNDHLQPATRHYLRLLRYTLEWELDAFRDYTVGVTDPDTMDRIGTVPLDARDRRADLLDAARAMRRRMRRR